MDQQDLFDEAPAVQESEASSGKERKPRLTLKAKKEAVAAIFALMNFRQMRDDDYEAPDGLFRVLESLKLEIAAAESRNGK